MTTKPEVADSVKTSSFWWHADKDAAHKAVFPHVQALEEDQRDVHEQMLRHAHLYANCDLVGMGWTTRKRGGRRPAQGRVSENVIQSVIDTATSMIAKNRPKASFMTDGAEWSVQRKARMLDKFVLGIFQTSGIYDAGVDVFRDGGVFGTGALKIYEPGGAPGTIRVERVVPDELIVDESQCRQSLPRELHQRKFVDREVLKAMYPGHEAEIDSAHKDDPQYTSYRRVQSDQVVVIESWHLRSGPKAKDGRHTITVQTATLHDAPFTDDEFPFVFYRWSKPLIGFYGQGLAEQLFGIQLRINKLNRFIEQAQDLIATPRVFVNTDAKQLRLQLTNEIGAVIGYRGNRPPVFHTPQAVGQEIYSYKERLKQSGFEFAGISQLSAQSKKPGGLESAVALREYNDIETQRFAIQAQRYEQVFAEAARHIVRLAKRIYGRSQKFTSVYLARRFVEKIEWSQVDLDEERFVIKIETSSILSRTPAGRLQAVIEMAQAGLIDNSEARRLLNHPDLEHSASLLNAGIEDMEANVEDLLDGKFSPPEPYQFLSYGIPRHQLALLRAKREGAPDDILEGFRIWIQQAEAVKQMATAGAAPAAPQPTPAISEAAAGGAPSPFAAAA